VLVDPRRRSREAGIPDYNAVVRIEKIEKHEDSDSRGEPLREAAEV
jgi:hypothetical protein